MENIKGLIASPGICFGFVLVYKKEKPVIDHKEIESSENELETLKNALAKSHDQLEALKSSVKNEYGTEFAHIFRSQQTIIEDDSITGEIKDLINDDMLSAEEAIQAVFSQYIEMFSSLRDDDYNKARLADIEDVYSRIINNVLNIENINLSSLPENTALVAEKLLPSDTALMDKKNISCFITEKGGITSHVAILAKTMQIPAAVKVENALSVLTQGKELILDASGYDFADITVSPDAESSEQYKRKISEYSERKKKLSECKDLEPETKDNHKMIFSGNIGSEADMDSALSFGVKSIGLFRSEFLFMNSSSLPDEETQFNSYKSVVEKLNGGMVIIRTLDIGGDKSISSFKLPSEENPFLGYRALRISLGNEDMFKVQLRAILRASAFGDVKVMFPMVSCVSEFRKAKKILETAKQNLLEQKIDFNDNIDIGIMVEIPSAAFSIDSLMKEADFASIGTNDLTQYLFAADRMNENVAEYYRPFHPAVFRAIKTIADAAQKAGKWAGICGELGGMDLAIPVLTGLGIHELSMTPQMLPENIYTIRNLHYSDCKKLASEVLELETQEEVKKILMDFSQRG